MKRLTFLFSIMVMLLVSGLITTPAGAAVGVLGSWATGTTHAKESGTNRALIFIAHGERTGTMNLSAVTYGGQSMTKVVEYNYSAASGYAYAAAFILKETGVAAASSSTFTVTWSGTAPTETGYSSVFLSGVDQTTATGATGTGGKTSNPVTTSALATSAGDMVILGATCGNRGSYTLNNSFIEGTDQQMASSTGVTGRKAATGANETPSATYSSTINRQMIIGLVVKGSTTSPPGQASNPSPANGATSVGTTTDLSWTAGSGATSHDVYFGTTSPGTLQGNQTGTTFDTGTMSNSTTYYWRIDEKNANGTTTGTVWSFTTAAAGTPPGAATSPTPSNGATSVGTTTDLSWTAGSGATSHDVYFGTTSPGTSRGNQTGTTYDTGTMTASTTYYWRIDEKNAYGTTTGTVWSFTTAAATTAVNINCGGSATGSFTADQYYSGGSTYTNSNTIDMSQIPTNPPPAAVFNSERYNACTYTIPNLTAGASYTVTLYFAESYVSASGARLFNVSINGTTVLSSFDIYASAGGQNKAIARTFTTTANSSGQVVIQLTAGSIQNPKINGISVAASGPTLSVSPTSLSVAAAAGSTGTFNITSNVSWTVSSDQAWLSVNPASGSNNATVTVTAQQNTGDARTATVTVSGTGVSSQTVTVTQASATAPTLSVSPTSLTVAEDAGSTGTFNVTSNASWTVSSNQTWLSVAPTSSSGNGTVTVTAQANTDGQRTATVTVTVTGVTPQTVTVTQEGSGGCVVPPMPSFSSLPNIAKLPDPFKFMDGSAVTTKADWDCRRLEIAALVQEFESGYKPNTPYSATTATYSGSTLTVTVTDNGKTISFSCSVSKPSGTGPFPVLLTCGGSNLGTVSGVATVNIPNDDIAAQSSSSSRGQGKFYTMYGSSHSASAMMAWAWGASRIIDAIEKTASTSNLDPTRIAVTGCSRNGKGALMCGAFDDRIDLTIPQESGSGGSGSWRVSHYEHDTLGQNTQELCEIVGENVWFRANFNQFCGSEDKLPTDHHELIGLVAPRAIYIIENNILWLGPESSWNCANAAKTIWTALGVPDKFGYSGTTEHTHCSFPSSQSTELNAYVGKYLIGGGTGTTGIMRCDPGYTYDQARWVDWSTPTLP